MRSLCKVLGFFATMAATCGVMYAAFWLGAHDFVSVGDSARVPSDRYVDPVSVPDTTDGVRVYVDHCRLLRGDRVVAMKTSAKRVLLKYEYDAAERAKGRCPEGTLYVESRWHFARMDEDYDQVTADLEEAESWHKEIESLAR